MSTRRHGVTRLAARKPPAPRKSRAKAKAQEDAPPTAPPCARPGCAHPRPRHFRGHGYPELCLHGQINEAEPCDCPEYVHP